MVLGILQPSFNSRKVIIKRKPGDISEPVTSPRLRLAKTPTRCFTSQLKKLKQIASPSLNTWLKNNSQQTAAQFTNRNVGSLILSGGQSSLGSDVNLPTLLSTGVGVAPPSQHLLVPVQVLPAEVLLLDFKFPTYLCNATVGFLCSVGVTERRACLCHKLDMNSAPVTVSPFQN